MTAADVQRVANKYFNVDQSTTGWFIPMEPGAAPTAAKPSPTAKLSDGPYYYRTPGVDFGPLSRGLHSSDTRSRDEHTCSDAHRREGDSKPRERNRCDHLSDRREKHRYATRLAAGGRCSRPELAIPPCRRSRACCSTRVQPNRTSSRSRQNSKRSAPPSHFNVGAQTLEIFSQVPDQRCAAGGRFDRGTTAYAGVGRGGIRQTEKTICGPSPAPARGHELPRDRRFQARGVSSRPSAIASQLRRN